MKKIYTFFIVVALVCPQAFSVTKTIVRETKGRGINRDEAINNALKQAVAQAKGVAISSLDTDFAYRSATADIERKPTGKVVEFDAVSVQTGGTTLRTDIAGLVKTYEVLDEKKIDDNTYEVTLKVWVYDYEIIDKTTRFRLAVMPIRALAASYRFGDLVTPAWDVSSRFSQKLAVALTQTNKFAVLDREYMQEFARERNIMFSPDAPLEEKAKLGQVLGVDYMLVGTITDAEIERDMEWSSAIGRSISEYEADFSFEYRLLIGPTRQIKFADVLRISLDKTEEIKKLVKKWEPQDLDYREMMDNFISMAANQVVETIIDRIYPIRIASITEDGQVIINQGGSRILVGQLLDIYSQGKELFDVDTKESLGRMEILVATVRIDKVLPRISYAKFIDGDLSKISQGLICRTKKVEEVETIQGRRSKIQRAPEGGVKLPFD